MTLGAALLGTNASIGTGGCVLNAAAATQGHQLLAQITHDGLAPSTPSGWFLRGTQLGSFSHSLSTYTKLAGASESSYTFTHSGDSGGVLIEVQNDAGDVDFDVIASDQTGSASTSFAAPAVIMTEAGIIVCTWVQIEVGSTITKPVSMTSLQSGDVFRSQASAHELVASGSTGIRTATATANATWIVATVGFKPAAAAGGSSMSHIDDIMAALTLAGFTTGTVSDRERARLLAKHVLTEPQALSMMDLYEKSPAEPARIIGE